MKYMLASAFHKIENNNYVNGAILRHVYNIEYIYSNLDFKELEALQVSFEADITDEEALKKFMCHRGCEYKDFKEDGYIKAKDANKEYSIITLTFTENELNDLNLLGCSIENVE